MSLHNIGIFAEDFPYSSGILHDMLSDEWSSVLTHKSLVAEGGQDFSVQVRRGGGKNIVNDYRGGGGTF